MSSENEDSNHTTPAQVPGESAIGSEDPLTSSPYTTRAVTVSIGASRAKYTVLQALVEQYSGLKERIDPANPDAPVELREVDEDIGHTLIHYLYTKEYQTLSLTSLPDDVRTANEFKRSVLAYCAARLCGIEKLEELTKAKIEELSKELSIFDIQSVAEEVTPKLPRGGDWFTSQVNKWVKASLTKDDNVLRDWRLYRMVGKSTLFDRALIKAIAELYLAKINPGASHERVDSGIQSDVVQNGVQNNDKPQVSRNSMTLVTQNIDDAVTKMSTDEYSPMPSEDPPESPFERRQSSIERNGDPSPDTVDTVVKPADSEADQPRVVLSKKARKKKAKKAAEAVAQQEQAD